MGGAPFEIRRASDVVDGGLGHVESSGQWDWPDEKEPRIHRIHAYPAKFPAFITAKAIRYASLQGVPVRRVGDVFCGCGTVALEARREGADFWGCDINPVATLIARVKSSRPNVAKFRLMAAAVAAAYEGASAQHELSDIAMGRLRRWYVPQQVDALSKLLNAIASVVPASGVFRDAFLCAFSAILKRASQWRRRAIKPHLDAHKVAEDPLTLFSAHCEFMASAWEELGRSKATLQEIHTESLMTVARPESGLDLIVTSPPYVTSYEYADLHQLSALWLGYADDYRTLREGSIGSTQHGLNFKKKFKHLNPIGLQVVFSLFDRDRAAAHAVANYYLDMQRVATRCLDFLAPRGIGVFVIGNTSYKGINVDNASHLAASLLEAGFKRLEVTKRRIANKAHTPYRTNDGKFSAKKTKVNTYAEEFILIAHQ